MDTVASPAAVDGEIRFTADGFSFKDAASGTYNPSPEKHKILRQLIHFIEEGPAEGFASGAYREITNQPFPTAVIWYTASDKLHKIVEKLITRDAGQNPTTVTWKVYSAADVLLATVTDTITYSGVFETSRTRAIA